MDNFLDLGRFLTSPANKQDALLFAGVESIADCKCLMERYLALQVNKLGCPWNTLGDC